MYSLLLMSAVATGGDTPAAGWGVGCYGSSCSGVVATSCYGYAAPAGCCGGVVTSCNGCCGGGLFSRLRARLAGRFSCGGCCGGYLPAASCYGCCGGSCYGSSCVGSSCLGSSCLGYGFGGCTGAPSVGYYAGYVPGGACYGNSAPGGVYYMGAMPGISTATFGFGFAGLPTFPQGYSMGGCYGTGVVGPHFYGADYNNPPLSAVTPSAPEVTAPAVGQDSLTRSNDERFAALDYKAAAKAPAAAPARLTVELPEDAVLYVDGEKVRGTGTTRNFHTPDLPAGSFFYDLKAVVVVDDEPVTETTRVVVKAGEAKAHTFGKLIAAAKAAKAPSVVVK